MESKIEYIEKSNIVRMIFIKDTGKRNSSRQIIGLFYCVCGSFKETCLSAVKIGATKSCGCWKSIAVGQSSLKNNTTHGMSKSSEFHTWSGMKARCYDKNHSRYDRYGGRGITICDRWLNSFENFYEDMGDKPSKKHSIHRKDNDGDYCPENCKWATSKEQARERSTSRKITYNGITKTLVEWSECLGISQQTLLNRLDVSKMDICEAFKTAINFKHRLVTINTITKNITDWAKDYNISEKTVFNRIYKMKWDEIKAITTPIRKEYSTTYNGKQIKIKELSNITGISYYALLYRINKIGMNGDLAVKDIIQNYEKRAK